ncbi:DUF4222 domain-containing protein [Shigella sonnei]
MKVKNSGFTASGPVRPEIHTGDIFFDKYGWMVKVISVEERRITCRREGYNYDCVTPVSERPDHTRLSIPRRFYPCAIAIAD